MTLIVTSAFNLNRVVAPRLPTTPSEFDQRYFDQYSSILRLYFNQLDNLLGQLVTTIDTLPVTLPSTNYDAFGRMRVSNPFTLFDSSHRFADNNLWATSTTGTAAATFSANEGLVNLTVGSASGDQVIRETIKVFSYQPGKSLLVMSTFVMGIPVASLRQRVGYYGAANGIYFERNGATNYMVERSSVSGVMVDTPVVQANWNQDPLDGTGPSGLTLDSSKAQILYMDVEWLGLGTVRTGFIINGQFVPAHNFDHANLVTTTYITTASLPLRYEMTNLAATGVTSTLKQVCSTVISEGGYQLAGAQQSIGNAVSVPTTLTTAATFYPVISLRLKSARLEGIAILTALSILGVTNNANYNWQVVAGGATTAGTWVSAGANSSVEYNLTGTAFTTGTGRVLASGFFQGSNQGATSVDILKQALFAFQLERNPFTATAYELTLICAAASNGDQVLASLDWEEISR